MNVHCFVIKKIINLERTYDIYFAISILFFQCVFCNMYTIIPHLQFQGFQLPFVNLTLKILNGKIPDINNS